MAVQAVGRSANWIDRESGQRASRETYGQAYTYNQNLWSLLQEAEADSALRIKRVVRDLVGPNPENPVTFFEWAAGQD